MRFAIVVEGESDAAAYPEIIQKVRDDVERVIAEPCGNDVKLVGTFVQKLKAFQWGMVERPHKTIVIRDSDCREGVFWEERMRHIFERERPRLDFQVDFHATKCELESWLLADENAVNRMSQQRGKNNLARRVHVQLEAHRDAKELFRRMLSQADLPADPQIYKEVAHHVDIAQIERRCPSFARFAEKVRA